VAFEAALAQNPRQLFLTGDVRNDTKALYDRFHKTRQGAWGGCYPRPSAEMIDKTWKAGEEEGDGMGVYLVNDIDVDHSSYPWALQQWE